MAAFSSTLYTNQSAGKQSTPGPGLEGNVKCLVGIVAVPVTLAANDTLNFGKVCAGATVVDAKLSTTGLDSNGTPTIAIDIGDATTDNRIFSGSTCGQTAAGAADAHPADGAIGFQYTADTYITGVIDTVAATKVAGTVVLRLFYTIEGMAS